MARLHEYQGKAILAQAGLATPRGSVASTPNEAGKQTQALLDTGATGVVIKIQAWTTGRKAMGGVKFAHSANEAVAAAEHMLGMKVGNFPVDQILIEEMIPIRDELFVSLSIDDASRQPVMLLALDGGSGIEDRAEHVHRLPVDVIDGIDATQLRDVVSSSTIDASFHNDIFNAINEICTTAQRIEARSVEVNPLVTTTDGKVIAADCRMTIDDYAVFRHPELNIEIARELDHPPTALERLAYDIEEADHRGTFYFAQLPTDSDKPIVGFHGAGGGGSMMSMDAITQAGFSIANFTDTSGNPSSAKVYRAARIILSQPDLVGYFGSGSGVASQEQFHSAYGLAKAFIEMKLAIPAAIRLGGNSEDRAVDILDDACKNLPAAVKGFRKDDTPADCATAFHAMVKAAGSKPVLMTRTVPAFVGQSSTYSFPITGGRVWIDHTNCDAATAALVVEHATSILTLDEQGLPTLAIAEDDVAKRDSELIACEIECGRAGKPVVFVDLPIDTID